MNGIKIRRRWILPGATVVFSHHADVRAYHRAANRERIAQALAELWPQFCGGRHNLIVCDEYEVVADFAESREIEVITVIFAGDRRRGKVENA